MKTTGHFLLNHSQFFLEWDMFQTKRVEEIKTHMPAEFQSLLIYALAQMNPGWCLLIDIGLIRARPLSRVTVIQQASHLI